MKIPVFGKSGPRLVTAGLVCASATVGPAAIQPTAASTKKNPRILRDIYVLPALASFCGNLSRHGVLSRYLGRPRPAPRRISLCTGGTRGLFTGLGYADDRPRLRTTTPATNRSTCHVDAKCGLSRDQLHAAQTQFADAYSRRRGLAADWQDAGRAR